jgi:glycosyltransferase involved in cell wall biosynthesis
MILAKAGFKVRFLGVYSQGVEELHLPEDSKMVVTILPGTSPGWRQKLAYFRFSLNAIILGITWRPDWIYVSDFMASPAGLALSRIFGLKVIYHEHDSPIARQDDTVFIRLMLAFRKALAKSAEFNILPQAERIRLFQRDTGTSRPVLRVWNCGRHADTLGGGVRQRNPGEPLCVYFHGSINLDRVPLALIEGAALSGVPVRLRVVGYETVGSQGSCEVLRKAVVAAGGRITLELPGAVSRHRLPDQMVGMHVGWINFINRSEDINLKHMVGASNKSFDYLAAGLPLIVPQESGWEEMFVAPGYAKSCNPNDVNGIADVLRWFYDNPVEAAAMGSRGQIRTQVEWNYEGQFKPVFERVLNKLVEK